ncbi:MFS transporter [Altererythrobacter sp. GH1-8]|uniref:MFS transporter n=1 Tax=Altererythrobacter sp. GH1-8 TaxID=3349333 RepID=UPI00374D66DD
MSIASTPVAAEGSHVGKLPIKLKLGWATGAFGVAMLMNGISTFILFYAVSVLGISPWLAGLVILLSKLFDVITDPIVGRWSDSIESPKGRRRPFLVWGAIISAISMAMVFTTPVFANEWLTATYLFFALCVYAAGFTIFNIPYLAMPAEMTDDYHERSSIHGYRIVFVASGAFLAAAILPGTILEAFGREEWIAYVYYALGCSGLIFITMMIAYFSTAKARFTKRPSIMTNLTQEFDAVWGNRHFLRLIGVKFAQLLGVQLTGGAFLFFLVQTLELTFYTLIVYATALTIATIVAAPVLVRISRKFGKREAYCVAAVCYIVGVLSWLLAGPGEPNWSIVARGIVIGTAATGNVVLAMSMLTDIIEWDSRRTGVRREGAYTALYSFVEKLTGALGPFIVGIALSIGGFDNSLPPDVSQGENVHTALYMTVAVLPAICGAIGLWLLLGYRLTEKELKGAPVASEPSPAT